METISLKVEKNLQKKGPESVTDQEIEEAIRKLEKYRGCMKGKAKMSDEEARDLAGRQMAKKFGIDLD